MMPTAPHGFSPLSDEEIDELKAFLMEDCDGAEAMMFDTMDGYMHAVATGPKTLKPQQWLPPIWLPRSPPLRPSRIGHLAAAGSYGPAKIPDR